jgi:hypothetical protein
MHLLSGGVQRKQACENDCAFGFSYGMGCFSSHQQDQAEPEGKACSTHR